MRRLLEIDVRCSTRGFISSADADDRELILRQVLRDLDEESEPWVFAAALREAHRHVVVAPLPLPTPTVAAAAPIAQLLALPDGVTAPLRSGDWAGLQARVDAGVLTEDQAREFGQIWMSLGRVK